MSSQRALIVPARIFERRGHDDERAKTALNL